MIGTAPGARGAPTFPQNSNPELGREPTVPLPCSLPALDRIWGRNPPWKCQSCSQPSPHCSILLFPWNSRSCCFSKCLLIHPSPSSAQEGTGQAGFLCSHLPPAAQPFSPCWGHLWEPHPLQERLSPSPEQPWGRMAPTSLWLPAVTSVIKSW